MFETTEAFIGPDGAVIPKGELFAEDEPIRRANPGKFKPAVSRRGLPLVEQATAAPGEQRGEPEVRRGPGRPRKNS